MKLCNEVWNGGSLESKNHKVYVLFEKENTEQVLLKIKEQSLPPHKTHQK